MRYLSDEWIHAADQAVRDAAVSAPGEPVVIDQHITDVVSYRIVIDPAGSSVTIIDADDESSADAVFRQSRETAVAVAQGTTDSHQAFLLGHIRFHGDINLLIEQRDAFSWLENALAPVLAATTFD